MLESYLSTFKSRWGAVAAAAAAGPVALFAADLSPPWPSENGASAAVFGTVATIIGLLLAYLDGAQRGGWRRRAAFALGGTLLLALIFAAVWSLTVIEIPQRVEDQTLVRRFVIGFAEHPDGLSPADAIQTYGPDGAFPRLSVLAGRAALLGSWVLMFLLLTFGFGLIQIREAEKPNGGTAPNDKI